VGHASFPALFLPPVDFASMQQNNAKTNEAPLPRVEVQSEAVH
jgi:preprotein translocase subunit SecB